MEAAASNPSNLILKLNPGQKAEAVELASASFSCFRSEGVKLLFWKHCFLSNTFSPSFLPVLPCCCDFCPLMHNHLFMVLLHLTVKTWACLCAAKFEFTFERQCELKLILGNICLLQESVRFFFKAPGVVFAHQLNLVCVHFSRLGTRLLTAGIVFSRGTGSPRS